MATQNLNQSSNSTNAQPTNPSQNLNTTSTLYLLNALPIGALPKSAAVLVREIDWVFAKQLVQRFTEYGFSIVSYIGHPSTAEVVGIELGLKIEVNRGEAKLEYGDHALVFTLARRVQGDVKVTKDDLRIYHVLVIHPDACRAIY